MARRLTGESRADHAEIARQLFVQPGTWGTVNTYPFRQTAKDTAGAIRAARQTFCVYGPPGSYDTRITNVEDGTLLEARYVRGTPSPKPLRTAGADEAWAEALAGLNEPATTGESGGPRD